MLWHYIQPSITPQLRGAIENAYRVFAKYRDGSRLSVCTCNVCMTPEQAEALRTTPLRAITTELLSEYTNSAHGYDFETIEPQFKGLLPRYFDLLAEARPPYYLDAEQCLIRLGKAEYRTRWPGEERTAVDAFFAGYVAACCQNDQTTLWPVGHRLSMDMAAIIVMIVLAGGDLDQVLAAWWNAADPMAAIHVAALLPEVNYRDMEPAFDSVFFDQQHDAAARHFGAWLCQPAWTERIEQAYLTTESAELREVIEAGTGGP